MLKADEEVAAATAQQHPSLTSIASASRSGNCVRRRAGRRAGARRAVAYARLQLLFFNQRPDATRHVVGQAFRHHYHGIIEVKT